MRMAESPFYKWYLLIVATLIQIFTVSMAWNSLPVLFTEIARDLDLSIVQIGVIWGMVPAAIFIFALPSGLIASKLGIRQVIGLGGVLVALTGGLRGISPNFITLVVSMFLFGASVTIIFVNLPKITRMWFPRHQLGLSIGVIQAGLGVGAGLGSALSAVVLSPLLGGWRNVLFLYAALALVLSVVWWQSVKGFTLNLESGDSASAAESELSLREILSRVVRSRDMWLCSIAFFGMLGAFMGMIHYLPIYLEAGGLSKVSADGIVASISWAAVVGNMVLPAMSDRIGSRKLILIPCLIIASIYIGLLPYLTGGALWAVAIIGGFVLPGCIPLLFAELLQIEDMRLIYAGTALGVMQATGHLGAFVAPIIGDVLATGNPELPFTFWASLAILSLVSLVFIRERKHQTARSSL